MSEVPARGPDADYCPRYPADGHHMVSRSGGRKVRWVEVCSVCGWINGAALDGYADNAVKESLTARAGRIAVAVETEPFSFVQPSSGDLPLREILTQAFAAVHLDGARQGLNSSHGRRLTEILERTQAEVERYARIERAEALRSVKMQEEVE